MAGGVNQVQHVLLAIVGRIVDADRVGLDGDTAFPLDIHAVEQLFLHVAILDRSGLLDEPVSKGGFAMVDMRDDGEIADMSEVCHGVGYVGSFVPRQALKRCKKGPTRAFLFSGIYPNSVNS